MGGEDSWVGRRTMDLLMAAFSVSEADKLLARVRDFISSGTKLIPVLSKFQDYLNSRTF